MWRLKIVVNSLFKMDYIQFFKECNIDILFSMDRRVPLLIIGLYMAFSSPKGVITTFPSDACLAKQF